MGSPQLQEFAEDAITDPVQLAAIARRLRRPFKLTKLQRWLIGTGTILAVLIIGALLGHYVL